jgi:hypothetical protein
MNNLVEVTLSLDPDHAAMLADVAGGEAHMNEYATTVIENALTDGQISDTAIESFNNDPLLLVDLYG